MEETLHLVYSFFMFITGLMFGSFFTLATYRIPRKQDIVSTRSYCPNCKHKLGFFDCFPILSYVSTIGRCRYCNKKISIRYPLIELANGFVFLFAYLILGFSWQTFVLLACYVYLFLVIGSDIMKSKMTEEEIAEANKIIEEKKKSKKKSGAINVEIIVAIIIFVVMFTVAIYTLSNYSETLISYKRKVDATNVCLNVINKEKAKEFNDTESYSSSMVIDTISYSYDVAVSNYVDETSEVKNNAKEVSVDVTYYVSGIASHVVLNFLKVVPSYEV